MGIDTINPEEDREWKAPEEGVVEKQEDNDEKTAEKLQSKLEKINSLEPSGDIANDFNEMLELTGRDGLYKKVSADEDPHVILAGLTGIKTAWQETLRDPNNVDVTNEAKKLFYIDVPQAEIEAINKLINFYLDKFSAEQEKDKDKDKAEVKPEKKDPLNEKLACLEESIYSVANSIEASHRKMSFFYDDANRELSHFDTILDKKYGNKLKESLEGIKSFFETGTKNLKDFPERVSGIVRAFEKMKDVKGASKEKVLEANWKMFVDLKKEYDEYQKRIKHIQSFMELKMEDHRHIINEERRRFDDDRKKISDLQEYNSYFNSIKKKLSEIFLNQSNEMRKVSGGIHNKILETQGTFKRITSASTKISNDVGNSDKSDIVAAQEKEKKI